MTKTNMLGDELPSINKINTMFYNLNLNKKIYIIKHNERYILVLNTIGLYIDNILQQEILNG